MRLCAIDILLLFFMAYACFMPEVFLFTDTLLLPKWYLLIVTVLGWILWQVCKRQQYAEKCCVNFINWTKDALILAAVFECCFVAYRITINGMSPIGEFGTFDNPAGLAVCMSIALPVAIDRMMEQEGYVRKALYAFASLCIGAVVILSKSRTGIICLAMYGIIYLFVYMNCKLWIKCAVLIFISVLACVYVTSNKKDSTSGRMFILQNTFELIREKTFLGYGHEGFERNYMCKQAEFFAQHKNSEYSMLADEMQHPLNEFAYVWVNYGVAAPIAMMLLFVCPLVVGIRKRNRLLLTLQLPALAVFVFSLFSYPFHYPLPWCVMATDLLVCINMVGWKCKMERLGIQFAVCAFCVLMFIGLGFDAWKEYKWKQAWKDLCLEKKDALSEYAQLFPYFSSNSYFLYNYTYALFSEGRYMEAFDMGKCCQNYWNGYNLQLLMGDACRMAKNYDDAITHYSHANNMCPSRLAPLEGLYLVYDESDQEDKRIQIAERIQKHEVKVQSYDTQRIKTTCK